MTGRNRAPNQADLLSLVDLIYAAAADASVWPDVLTKLARVLHVAVASVNVTDLRRIASSVEWSIGADPAFVDSYVRYYSTKNIYLAAGAPLIATGAVLVGEHVVPDRISTRSEFVNDFMRPLGILHNTVGCIYRDGDVTALLSLSRNLGKPSSTPSEIAFVRRLIPHFQRALVMHRRLEGAELGRMAANATLDRLTVGTIIVDRGGKVLHVNRSAQDMLGAGDGLMISREGLAAARATECAELRRQIHAACEIGIDTKPAAVVIQVARPSSRRAYSVVVAPLRLNSFALSASTPGAIVFIYDADQQLETCDEMLQRLYGLTVTEARVAGLLLRGLRVDDVAEELAISKNTARTHLKQLFSKTGTHSQSELMRILLSGPAQLRLNETSKSAR